jgi:hypothetical protein
LTPKVNSLWDSRKRYLDGCSLRGLEKIVESFLEINYEAQVVPPQISCFRRRLDCPNRNRLRQPKTRRPAFVSYRRTREIEVTKIGLEERRSHRPVELSLREAENSSSARSRYSGRFLVQATQDQLGLEHSQHA